MGPTKRLTFSPGDLRVGMVNSCEKLAIGGVVVVVIVVLKNRYFPFHDPSKGLCL